jgi:hypothetical protein
VRPPVELTDTVIDDAVRRMPREFYAVDGPVLARKLKARREAAAPAARRFYEILADEVELHATDPGRHAGGGAPAGRLARPRRLE